MHDEPTETPGGTSAETPHEATIELTVGKIGRAHGLRGDVFVDVRTDDPDRRFAAGTTFATPRGDLVVETTRWHGNRLLAHFHQIRDRDAAELLRGVDLVLRVPRHERPADPEEFYDHQLRELTVHTVDDRLVGRVVDVLHLPAQDTLVVDVDGREVLVPFVEEIVPTVDLTTGRIEIVELPGLLADDEPEPSDEE